MERVGVVTDRAHINPRRSFRAGKSSVFQGIRTTVSQKAQRLLTAEASKMTFRDLSLATVPLATTHDRPSTYQSPSDIKL